MTEMVDFAIVLVAGAICAALAVGAWRTHILDEGGAISAFLIGFVTFVVPADGWKWFVVLLVFLSVSSYMTHYKYQAKRKKGFAQEKGGARGWPNVTANGVVAGLVVLLIPFFPRETIILAAFLGAVATANADTLATEIGLLNPSDPQIDHGLEEDRSRWNIWRRLPLWRACHAARRLGCRYCCWTFGNDGQSWLAPCCLDRHDDDCRLGWMLCRQHHWSHRSGNLQMQHLQQNHREPQTLRSPIDSAEGA